MFGGGEFAVVTTIYRVDCTKYLRSLLTKCVSAVLKMLDPVHETVRPRFPLKKVPLALFIGQIAAKPEFGTLRTGNAKLTFV
jgi:hypothetical protein